MAWDIPSNNKKFKPYLDILKVIPNLFFMSEFCMPITYREVRSQITTIDLAR